MPRARRWPNRETGKYLLWYCPGCQCSHMVAIKPEVQKNGASWEFNGDFDRPTLTPSVMSSDCHCHITNGQADFRCGGNKHALDGQVVDIPEQEPGE